MEQWVGRPWRGIGSGILVGPAARRPGGKIVGAAVVSALPYRPNVGAVLFNPSGLVLVARRADLPNTEAPAGGRVATAARWHRRGRRFAPGGAARTGRGNRHPSR